MTNEVPAGGARTTASASLSGAMVTASPGGVEGSSDGWALVPGGVPELDGAAPAASERLAKRPTARSDSRPNTTVGRVRRTSPGRKETLRDPPARCPWG